MLDPVVGESSSWIRVNAVFSNHSKGNMMWHEDWSSDFLKIWKLPYESFQISDSTSFWHTFAFIPPVFPPGQDIMGSLGTGVMCSLGYVVRNILEHKGAVTVYQSRGCISVCNGSWGSGLAMCWSVCTISHWRDKWLAFSCSLFLDFMQSSIMYFVRSSYR